MIISTERKSIQTKHEGFQNQYRIHAKPWNVYVAGSGQPILFLHNGGGTLWNWIHQLEYFSRRYTVIAPDLPGFGRSHRPAAPLTLDSYVRDISKLLEVLNISNPILVGNCIGASIALEFALRASEKVKALALFNICGGPPMLSPQLQFWAGLQPSTKLGRMLHRSLIDTSSHPVLQRLGTSFFYADGEPALHPMLTQVARQQRLDPKQRASLYSLVSGLDSFSILSEPRTKPLPFPAVLLGWGRQNRTLPVQWAHRIQEWLMPDRFWLIDEAGHMPMYEKPDQVNQALEDFFNTIQ